jgi:hypothetical protein
MLQSGVLAVEDMRWLWGLCNVWETVIVCSDLSKTLAPVSRQHVISYAPPLLWRVIFIPCEQQQNPDCQEEMI